jgi:acetyltransferase-like isoleucine patch superfamily enzyme
MNLDYLARRLLGRPTCVLGSGAKLYPTARIRNVSGNDDHIRVGRSSLIVGELLTFAHGGKIDIGEWCYVGTGTRIWSALSITIGDRVLIAHNVNIFDSLTHPINAEERHKQFIAIVRSGHPKEIDLDERAVDIASDAWIGAHAIILRGVSIGRGSIVGAGAVVTKNIPPYTIVAGNPARTVRELTPSERRTGPAGLEPFECTRP